MGAGEESISSKTEYGILERISIAVTGLQSAFGKVLVTDLTGLDHAVC